MHLFYILLFSLMVLFTYQYWSGFRQSVNWQFPIGLLILASLFLRGIWVPIVLFGLVGLFFHLHWAGNQQIIPWSPLGLLGIALVTALGVFVLSLWFLSLPRQGNSTLQGGTIPSYLEPWFTIEGQLVGKHHKHLYLLDFHAQTVDTLSLPPFYSFSPDMVLYWQKKHLLYLNNEQKLYPIRWAKPRQVLLDSPSKLQHPRGWQDFPEKVAREFRQSWLEVGFYLTILLTLFGLPLMSWWGLKGLPAAKQGTGKKSWYIVLVIYANLALIALGFQITLLNTYL